MSVRFLQLSQYTSPQIVEDKRNDWVNYGEDNNYFQHLIGLYHSSPTNNAAVKGISDLVFGSGLEVVKADRNLEGYVHLKKMFRDRDIRKVVMDFKMLGQACFQLIKSKDGKKYIQAEHFPIHTLRPEKMNEDGEVEGYYYHPNWAEYQQKDEPTRIPAYGFEGSGPICVYVIKPYSTGNEYFNPVDYQGGLQYSELEGEIANYHLNNIKNGMTPTMILNMNNGIPDERKQQQIESKILHKFSGSSNAGKLVLAFNEDKDSAATIEPIQLSDAHNQYQFLSTECMTKIMVSHRITSPMLLGIKDNSGLGNNAEELKTASTLFDNIVIRPFQQIVLDAIDEVMNANGYNLNMYFKTLQPLEFVDLSGKVVTEETQEKETGLELSTEKESNAQAQAFQDMSNDDEEKWLSFLYERGETIDEEEWELIDEEVVTDPDAEEEKYKFFKRFANPTDKSQDDSGMYKIRYSYTPESNSTNSRTFCSNMVANAKMGVVYRREDINAMDGVVNTEFAPQGRSSYSIWKFKGGANCHHAWKRKVYFRKRGEQGQFLPKSTTADLENDKRVTDNEARSAGVPGEKFQPRAWDKAQTRPIDMPNGGRLNR